MDHRTGRAAVGVLAVTVIAFRDVIIVRRNTDIFDAVYTALLLRNINLECCFISVLLSDMFNYYIHSIYKYSCHSCATQTQIESTSASADLASFWRVLYCLFPGTSWGSQHSSFVFPTESHFVPQSRRIEGSQAFRGFRASS